MKLLSRNIACYQYLVPVHGILTTVFMLCSVYRNRSISGVNIFHIRISVREAKITFETRFVKSTIPTI
jgi:hypothetical protein